MSSVDNSHHTNPPFYFSLLAGALGQSGELLLGGHVLHRIATEQQAHPERGTLIRTIKHLYQKNGAREFYNGLRWSLAIACGKGMVRWGLIDPMFCLFSKYIPQHIQKQCSWLVPAAVGLGGAVVETTVYLCPLESLRTREMTQDWQGVKRMWKVVRSEGLSIFFKGWTRLYCRQAITWATYLITYDRFKQKLVDNRKGNTITKIDKSFMYAMTGAAACLLNTPFDMLRTQTQMYKPLPKSNIIFAFKQVIDIYGFKAMYRSLPTRIMRSSFYAVVTFTVMDRLNVLPERMKIR